MLPVKRWRTNRMKHFRVKRPLHVETWSGYTRAFSVLLPFVSISCFRQSEKIFLVSRIRLHTLTALNSLSLFLHDLLYLIWIRRCFYTSICRASPTKVRVIKTLHKSDTASRRTLITIERFESLAMYKTFSLGTHYSFTFLFYLAWFLLPLIFCGSVFCNPNTKYTKILR